MPSYSYLSHAPPWPPRQAYEKHRSDLTTIRAELDAARENLQAADDARAGQEGWTESAGRKALADAVRTMESQVREAEQAAARKGKCDLRETRAEAERTAAEAKGAPAGSPLHKAAQAALDAVLTAELALAKKGVDAMSEHRTQAERTAAAAEGAPTGSDLQQAAKQARDALANAEKVNKERG